MSDLRLDANGDLSIVNGDLSIISDKLEIDQLLKQRLQFFSGEWFLDIEDGLPWFDEVFVKNPDPVILNTIFKDIILTTPGVLGLDEFDLTLDTVTRVMTLSFRARTTEGPITFEEFEL